jgi:hypothetical protein
VTDQDSKIAKVIRESRWNAKHEYDANHAKKALDRYSRSDGFRMGSRSVLWTGSIMAYITYPP